MAAILVLVHHVRGVFLVDYATLAHPSAVVTSLYLLTSLGHRAVVVFFVLSGYLIGFNVLQRSLDGGWQWLPYFLRRLTRLLVVLLPALALTLALDLIGRHMSGSAIYHGQLASESVITFDISQRDSVANLFGNVLFLQDIWVLPFGSDAPLWSLSYEFWYYLLFPLFVVAIVGAVSGRRRITFIALGVAVLFFIGPTIDAYFLLWLLGAGVALTLMRWPGVATGAVFRVGLAAGALSLVAVSFTPTFRTTFSGDVLWAFATAALIVIIQSHRVAGEGRPKFYRMTATAIAGCSYTLYLVHLPLLILMRSLVTPLQRWQPSFSVLLTCVFIAFVAFGCAYAIGHFTERNTTNIRKWMESRLARGMKSAGSLTQPTPLS